MRSPTRWLARFCNTTRPSPCPSPSLLSHLPRPSQPPSRLSLMVSSKSRIFTLPTLPFLSTSSSGVLLPLPLSLPVPLLSNHLAASVAHYHSAPPSQRSGAERSHFFWDGVAAVSRRIVPPLRPTRRDGVETAPTTMASSEARTCIRAHTTTLDALFLHAHVHDCECFALSLAALSFDSVFFLQFSP